MRNKIIYLSGFVGTVILAATFWFVHFSRAQALEEVRNATLLKEYFLPISALAPVEEGKLVIGPNECNKILGLGALASGKYSLGAEATPECAAAPIDQKIGYGQDITIGTTVKVKKITAGLELNTNAAASYDFTTTEPGIYQLRLSAFDGQDSFYNLTRNQYDNLSLASIPAATTYPDSFPGFPDATKKELIARSMVFQVFVDGKDVANFKGFINLNDTSEVSVSSLDVGLLNTGTHTVYLAYVNDISDITLPLIPNLGKACKIDGDCGDAKLICNGKSCIEKDIRLNNFQEADKDKDGKLGKRPVLTNLEMLKTQRTNDVMGVRVYTNPGHLSAQQWYAENLVNPGNPVPFQVDGYTGVLDNRVAYINAANISITKALYTNIYVIAYNLNASPQTVNIFNQIVNNWKFNKNILDEEGVVEGEKTKDRLRRDTQRLEEINVIRAALESYKQRNGAYPDLKAGTFDVGHVVSTWPTWQSVLGNDLGQALPVDPLNMMATDFHPRGSSNTEVPRQYDCTDEYENTYCKNICSRDGAGKPLTGCQLEQQCVTGATGNYCSVVAPGFDPLTGWNQESKTLYFKEKADGTVKVGVYPAPEGGYNTFGTDLTSSDKYKDDAFVYQYTTLDGGKTYSFNYRLEYQNYCLERAADGSCLTLSSTRCGANSCYLESLNYCLNPGESLYSLKPQVVFNFDETSGIIAKDAAGNAAGTLIGGASFVTTGKNGGAVKFDGISQYVSVPDSTKLDPTDAVTAMAWVKLSTTPDSTGLHGAGVVSKGSSASDSNDASYEILVLNDLSIFSRVHIQGSAVSPDTKAQSVAGLVDKDTWVHVAMTYDGANLISYVNGLPVATTPLTGKLEVNSKNLAIGSRQNMQAGTTGHFPGLIDEVKVFGRALSREEINGYFSGTAVNFEVFKNQYCFSGSIVNSCGNGILQPEAGEQCEFAKSEGVFCDERYGSHAWYNEANISNKCTTTCQLADQAATGELPQKYDPRPGLSCGGFCGDSVTQYEYNEQCDQGSAGGANPLPAYGGTGGLSADSQYACYAPTEALTTIDAAKLADDTTPVLSDYWKLNEASGTSAVNTANSAHNGTVKDGKWVPGKAGGTLDPNDHGLEFNGTSTVMTTTAVDVSPTAKPVTTWSAWVYPEAVNLPHRQHILSTDNGGYDRAVVIEQGTSSFGVFTGTRLCAAGTSKVCTDDKECDEVSGTCNTSGTYKDRCSNNTSKACTTLTETLDCPIVQSCSIHEKSIWLAAPVDLNRWQHIAVSYAADGKVYFYKNGVEYFDPSITATFDASSTNLTFGRSNFGGGDGTDYFNGILDEVKVYNRTLTSTEINQVYRGAVGGCKSYDGYCGDGLVQTNYGEQCDTSSFIPPTPKRSVDQLSNAGFELGHDAWLPVFGTEGVSSRAENLNTESNCLNDIVPGGGSPRYVRCVKPGGKKDLLVRSGDFSYQINPKAEGAGIGQQVSYQPGGNADGSSTVDIRVDMRANSVRTGLVAKLRLYNYDFVANKAEKFKDVTVVKDYLETTLQTVSPVLPDITAAYQTFVGSVKIPAAVISTTGGTSYLNTVTLASIVFTVSDIATDPVTVFPTDMTYYLDNVEVNSTFRLNYSCTTVKGKLCQLTGGYCGDGIVQKDKGEVCDNAALNGTDTANPDGVICNKYCSLPFCGDGKMGFQDVGGKPVKELCDSSDLTDPNHDFCGSSCSQLGAGGYCKINRDCDSGSCIKGRCAFAFGQGGCSAKEACPDGMTCDPEQNVCRPRTDLYLQYHSSAVGIPGLFNGNPLTCPALSPKKAPAGTGSGKVILDDCTGLKFYGTDFSQGRPREFSEIDCGLDTVPTIKQLYSLLSATPYYDSVDDSTSYVKNDLVTACSLAGMIGYKKQAGPDTCIDRNDDRYLYWSKTPYGTNMVCSADRVSCTPATESTACTGPNNRCISEYNYVLDMRNGTVDVLPTDTLLNSRCVNSARCGNGIKEAGEQCEFDKNTQQEIGIDNGSCSGNPLAQKVGPFTDGRVHCDINTCQLRFDNCAVATDDVAGSCMGNEGVYAGCTLANQAANCKSKSCTFKASCNTICGALGNDAHKETVKSFGLNLTENYPSRNPQNNDDLNRRPKWNKPITDSSCIVKAGDTGNLENPYCYSTENGKAVFESLDSSADSYAVADDGKITNRVSTDGCEMITPTADLVPSTTGANCPYGYEARTIITNYNSATEVATSIYKDANAQILDQKPQATLCNCTYHPDYYATVAGTAGDVKEVDAINNATDLVEQAERTWSNTPTPTADLAAAQCVVSELLGEANCASTTDYVILKTKKPADDLQARLNALAETSVIVAENTTQEARTSFSRWTFDEGVGRISYNVGLARTTLDTGTGRDATIACSGEGCTRNVTWPIDGRWGVCSDPGKAMCGANSDCTAPATCVKTAMHFDGIDDYGFTDARGMSITDGTISLWVKPDTFVASTCSDQAKACGTASECGKAATCDVHDQTLFNYFDTVAVPATGVKDTQLEISVNKDKYLTAKITGGCPATIGGTLASWTAGTWHNIVLTYKGSAPNFELYFDGTKLASSSTSCTSVGFADPDTTRIAEQITFGAKITDLSLNARGNFFRGSLDESRIYGYVLTTTQISDLFTKNTIGTLPTIAASGASGLAFFNSTIPTFSIASNLAKAGYSLYNLFSAFPAGAVIQSASREGSVLTANDLGITENLLKFIYIKISSLFNR